MSEVGIDRPLTKTQRLEQELGIEHVVLPAVSSLEIKARLGESDDGKQVVFSSELPQRVSLENLNTAAKDALRTSRVVIVNKD